MSRNPPSYVLDSIKQFYYLTPLSHVHKNRNRDWIRRNDCSYEQDTKKELYKKVGLFFNVFLIFFDYFDINFIIHPPILKIISQAKGELEWRKTQTKRKRRKSAKSRSACSWNKISARIPASQRMTKTGSMPDSRLAARPKANMHMWIWAKPQSCCACSCWGRSSTRRWSSSWNLGPLKSLRAAQKAPKTPKSASRSSWNLRWSKERSSSKFFIANSRRHYISQPRPTGSGAGKETTKGAFVPLLKCLKIYFRVTLSPFLRTYIIRGKQKLFFFT